jgi:hypothetical protein
MPRPWRGNEVRGNVASRFQAPNGTKRSGSSKGRATVFQGVCVQVQISCATQKTLAHMCGRRALHPSGAQPPARRLHSPTHEANLNLLLELRVDGATGGGGRSLGCGGRAPRGRARVGVL